VLAAGVSRWALLGRDTTASGFDAWYYVLQVRSLQEGQDRFGDDSWAFPVLRAAAWLTGDVVVGNELVAGLAAMAVTAALALAGGRLGGASGALVSGAVAASATGHLALTAEFLKNAIGVVPLAAVAWLLARRPGPAAWAGAVGLAVLASGVHKLAGVMCWAMVLGVAATTVGQRHVGRGVGVGVVVVAGGAVALLWGVVGVADLDRSWQLAGLGDRARGLARLPAVEAAEMVAVAIVPVLAAWAYRRGLPAPQALTVAALGVVCTAPGLPFGFDGVAWRLMVMGFVPLAWVLAALRPGPGVALALALGAVGVGAANVASHRQRGPDYAAWGDMLPIVQATVGVDERLVAHRGLCGFLWAQGERPCENFEPAGDLSGVWRVTYGFSEQALAPYGPSVPLRRGYRLIREPAWQAFRAEQGQRFPLAFDPRNPYRPPPAYVKRPLEAP